MKKNEESIKSLLQKFVRKDSINDQYHAAWLKDLWVREMGPMIAEHTGHMSFSKGTLTIEITSAPLRHELHGGSQKIIGLLNESLGQSVVEKLRLI